MLTRARPSRPQGGFFLIEAMVAILIFALGILGLVAMGGAAVSSQSDAQYRTEASSLADAIAGEIAIGINRSTRGHQGGDARCVRTSAESRADDGAGALRVRRRGDQCRLRRPVWPRC